MLMATDETSLLKKESSVKFVCQIYNWLIASFISLISLSFEFLSLEMCFVFNLFSPIKVGLGGYWKVKFWG